MNAVKKPQPEVRVLKAKRASPEALAPYGEILGFNPNIAPLPIDFYGGKAKVRRVVNFESDEDTELTLVTVDFRNLEVSHMERHPKHTQAFVSLNNKPFVAVFAPPSDSETPDISKAEAFLFDGEAGFVMKKNCWHEFPFSLFDAGNNGIAHCTGLDYGFNCVGSDDLYGLIRVRAGYTPASGEKITIRLKILQAD